MYRVVPITKRGNLSTGNLVLWTLHQVITPQCKTSIKLTVTNASHWAEKNIGIHWFGTNSCLFVLEI